ncbi:MAG: DNA endonuclease SmrA [Gammaproteobacteria bacterium]|nr:DNA endonuclease SmrA [Gammaproteobacteria bacterium]NND38067.1 DNA endonuclease SmrA [Pseudomonadales bacterium]MBT8152245.1 DNA endonuclease SmrA [Gammaproteobacteria bacterium]NNL11411.1 DNA endonuclease SmrA [Pseudomonadales bacterium]NNM12632.1 DNA endonuclease SmrA [Pseudomonadales bacterium]
MQGVRPLKKADKVRLPKKPVVDPEQAARRQQRALGEVEIGEAENGQSLKAGELRARPGADYESGSFVSDDYVEMLKPDAILAFKRPGIQEGVYRKLRLGKYPLQARLDLHRKTVHEARREVFDFIRESEDHDLRCVLILHGKGDRNLQRPAVLKSYTAKWLQEISQVMAFHSAQQNHGGAGAVYVLLRKSERMKEKTREQHSGGR